MSRVGREAVSHWVEGVLAAVPCGCHDEARSFIEREPDVRRVPPRPELRVGDHWFCTRRYRDTVDMSDYLQIYFGCPESAGDWTGYDRLDPDWEDEEGRVADSWELTRAYVKPRYRGRNYCSLLV